MSRRPASRHLARWGSSLAVGWACVGLLLGALVTPGVSHAATAKARTDQHTAHVGAAVTLTITVSGARSVGKTRLPALDSFDVVPGVTQMRSGWSSGRAVQQIVLTYYLYPKKVGSFTIDSIGVDADGRTVWTSPLSLEVVPAREHSGPLGDHFLDVSVKPEAPYAGQPIVYTVRFGFSTSIQAFDLQEPDWGGLLEEASLTSDESDTYQVIDGRRFRVLSWGIPLFSLRPGIYEIGAATAGFGKVVGVTRRMNPLFNDPIFDQFFSTAQLEPVELTSEPLTVEVRALPAHDKPPGFSGLVGTARLRGALSRDHCQVGESVSLTLELRGLGNLQDVDLEPVIPEGIKPYPQDSIRTLQWGPDGPYGTVTRVLDLVPLTAGEAVIPALEVSYFDPDKGSYRSAEAGPFRLSIAPGEGGEAHSAHSADLLVGEDALELLNAEPYPAMVHGGHRRLANRGQLGLLLGALAVPPGAFGVCALVRTRQRKRADPERQRRQRAHRKALSSLAQAEDDDGAEPPARAADLEGALRDFLSERAGLSTGALGPEELRRAVEAAGASRETAAELGRWVADAAAVRYAGRVEPSIATLAEHARSLIEDLSEELP